MKFLGMGWPELLIILAVILIIFGPKNLPKLGKAIGKGIKSLRKGMSDGEEENAEGEATDGTTAPVQAEAAAAPEQAHPQSTAAPVQEGTGTTTAPKTVKRVVRKAADTTAADAPTTTQE